MTLIVIRHHLTMAVNRHVSCELDLSSRLRNQILCKMIVDHQSVVPLLRRYLLTSCQIANCLRELSVCHFVTIHFRLDIDVWEMDP
jgi:hypothetical protein